MHRIFPIFNMDYYVDDTSHKIKLYGNPETPLISMWRRQDRLQNYDTVLCNSNYVCSLLYCACCQVTQLFYQPLHIYEFIKFTH